MFSKEEVYRLCTDRFAATFGAAPNRLHSRRYIGQLIPGGQEAAIEVVGDMITGYLNGCPSSEPEIIDVIEGYRDGLLAAARKLRRTNTDRVVLTGTWVDIDFDSEPYLHILLVHIVFDTGVVVTKKYDLDLFDWDASGDGPKFYVEIDDEDGAGALSYLRQVTEGEVRVDHTACTAKGYPVIRGILWFPEAGQSLPVIATYSEGEIAIEARARMDAAENARRLAPWTPRAVLFRDAENAIAALRETLLARSEPASSAELEEAFTPAKAAVAKIIDGDDSEIACANLREVFRKT